jgi:hypothetical protein
MTSTKRNQRIPALGVVALGLLTMSSPAWAYLDPGTGSMIISAIVGLFATVGLAVKTYWYKLKGFFRRDERRADAQTQPAVDASIDRGVEQGTEAERTTES